MMSISVGTKAIGYHDRVYHLMVANPDWHQNTFPAPSTDDTDLNSQRAAKAKGLEVNWLYGNDYLTISLWLLTVTS